MSRVISGSVVVLVLVAVVLAAMWARKDRSGPLDGSGDSGSPKAPEGARPPQPAEHREENNPEEPVAQLPEIPPPTAEWLRAAANPLRVVVKLDDRRQQARITPAGDTLTTTMRDGTRVSLVFPAGSLWRSEDVTIQVVEGLGEVPFASAPLAVSISPENLSLRHPPILQFEPGRRTAFDGSRTVAGFAVRGGNELSLYPAAHYEIERAPGRYRIAMALTRLGTYGVTNATHEEIMAFRTREPGDLAARVEQRIVLAFEAQPPNRAQIWPSGWTLAPRVHAQGGISLFIYDLVKQLLEYYQQKVVPKFDRLPTNDCRSGATFDAINTYLHWRASVELLMPLQKDTELLKLPQYREVFDRLVAQRETKLRERGYTAEQIEEINRAIEQFREQFENLSAAIDKRIVPALSAQFGALYRCCTTQPPMAYHLTAMLKVLRFGELNGYVPVDPEPMKKVMDCACLVGSNEIGARERFTGTLSYEENTALEKTEQKATRTILNSEKLSFSQSSVLTFMSSEGMLANSTVTGNLVQASSTTDDHGTCVVHNGSQLEVAGGDNDNGLVNIDVDPQQGKYTLSFQRLPLEGSGTRRTEWHVTGPGCGKFNRPRNQDGLVRMGISPVPTASVTGELDVNRPRELKGSHVFEQLDPFYNKTRKGTLKWDIQRCKR